MPTEKCGMKNTTLKSRIALKFCISIKRKNSRDICDFGNINSTQLSFRHVEQ